jgi:succinate dehydrogenase/fumarate reductase flavoprotein subunit/uncharacterized protein with FMN-binding domain
LKKLCLILALIMLFVTACGQSAVEQQPQPQVEEEPETEVQPEAGMKAGTYTAVCHGFYGDFDISVTVSESEIVDIQLGDYKETEAVGGKALKIMTERMIEENTAEVDLVSGATVTSMVFRSAVKDCLTQANAPQSMLTAPPLPQVSEKTVDTDVLVIGGGAAGFASAISAAENGAKVTLIEKQDIVGGSTIVSAGIVYGALSEDDVPKMVDYYMERAEQKADRDLLEFYARNSIDTIAFLEGLGVKWMMNVPAGTAPEPRAHFSMHDDGTFMIGSALINPMEARARELGVEVLTGVKGTELIVEDGEVIGAKAESKTANYTFNAKAVVLATGGFDASEELKEKYSPVAVGDFPLSNKGNVGEGLIMGIEAGAATEFKGGAIGFQIVDGSLPNSGYNASAMNATAFVKKDGTFVALGNDYPINYTNLKASGEKEFYGLYDAAGKDNAEPALEKGFGFKADTVEELAELSGMDVEKLQDAFDKTEALATAPYYAVVVKPATIGSMGGLKINTRAEVLAEANNEPITGLYAAGEVANPGFYYQEYPASGSSISLSITYGREAGKNAAELAKIR